ncbi:MAG: transposase [Solirubrobacteraceae bacterium]
MAGTHSCDACSTDLGKELYRKRQQSIEPVYGHTKHNRRFDRFHRRGRLAVHTECLSYVKRFSLVASFVR